MDKTLVKNYIYNILYQVVKIVCPLVLVPYTAAHIDADALGIYNYAGSIMNWFILFGILGVNTYGNREIAKVRNDPKKLNTTFFEVFYMQLCNMVIAIIAYFVFIQFTVSENLFYYQLTGATMLASMLDITWFFYGIEDFKKASLRNIIVKILGVVLIMCLVKSPEDLGLYILINVGSELLGQAIMFVQLRQYISFEKVSLKDAYHHHFKATVQLFIPTIAISVYTMLDKTMIGALYNETHVTYYQTSQNIIQMFLTMITSIGSIMLPRVTNVFYNEEGGQEKAQHYVGTTMKIALMLALPMCFGMMSIAQSFIAWYIPNWPIVGDLILIGCPIIVFISMSNVTGTQYMVPTHMYNQYSFSVIAGSCVNFICNYISIPKYGAYGAIIGSVIAECTVTSLQLFFIHKKVKFGFKSKSYLLYVLGTIAMVLTVNLLKSVLTMGMVSTFLEVLAGVIVYFLVLFIGKEELLMHVFQKAMRRKANA